MKIAILGPGAIGSTFAFQLSRAGHDVTVIARGARLQWLEKERAIVRSDGARAAVTVARAVDPAVPFDLLLVTVLATQVDAVLPSLRASAARRVMFMFNTFEPLEPLREAVGAARFCFGFPAGVFTLLIDGKIHTQIRSGTTVDHTEFAELFSAAGVPTVVERDMHSWLRSHAALVIPLMSIGVLVDARDRGITFREALLHARAFARGFEIVRRAGHAVLPTQVASVSKLPRGVLAALLWLLSRTKMLRDLGRLGPTEARMLIDMMHRAAPDMAAPLLAIRP
jgi:2-dehydropantoate 2-reductase